MVLLCFVLLFTDLSRYYLGLSGMGGRAEWEQGDLLGSHCRHMARRTMRTGAKTMARGD